MPLSNAPFAQRRQKSALESAPHAITYPPNRRAERRRVKLTHLTNTLSDLLNGERADHRRGQLLAEASMAAAAQHQLAKSAGGADVYSEQLAALAASFATDEAMAELAHAKKLERLLRALAKRSPTARDAKAVQDLAAKARGTKVAERAERLAERIALAADIQ